MRPIPGATRYAVDPEGRIHDTSTSQVVSTSAGRYQTVSIRLNVGITARLRVHEVVALAYLGVRPEGHVVRHLNDDQSDNRPENLAYGTHGDNAADAVRNGKNLAPSLVHEVRRRVHGGEDRRSVASDLGLEPYTVSNIASGRTYKTVPWESGIRPSHGRRGGVSKEVVLRVRALGITMDDEAVAKRVGLPVGSVANMSRIKVNTPT